MKLAKLRLAILVAALVTGSTAGTATAAVTRNAEGWTIVTPSSDSRIVYVSNSQGNDSNNGLSPSTPKKTIQAGAALIRSGYPDHLLLRRGDVFPPETTGTLLGNWKNGRSAQEPVLVSSYGNSGARPVVIVLSRFVDHNGNVRNYNSFIGLDIYKANSDPANSTYFSNSESTYTFRMVGGGANLLIEDCRFRFGGMNVESWTNAEPRNYSDVQIRRNIVVDAWKHNSSVDKLHISGIYMSGVKGSYLIEENYWDHNGWNTSVPGAGANMYAHNLYIQYSNVAGGIMRGNISVRPAAHGMQSRSGGVIERNLFAHAAVGVNIGGVDHPTDSNVLTFDNRMVQNVVINGRLMDPSNTNWPRTTAVWGIIGSYVGDVDVVDNIVANRVNSGNNVAIGEKTNEPPINMILSNNIVYNWQGSMDMNNSSWPHPDADLGDYWASVGGPNSEEAYYQAQRNRGPGELPWHLTAYAAISYIRDGFNKSAVSGYYQYPNEPVGGGGDPDNIALGASVTTSSNQVGNVGANMVDGDTGDESRWSAQGYPQNATIDLGANYDVEEFSVHPLQNRAYQYTIQLSTDGTSYSTVVNRSSNTQGGSEIVDTISPTTARYVRINVTGASGYTGDWISIREFEVFGEASGSGGSGPQELLSNGNFSSGSVQGMGGTAYTLGTDNNGVWLARPGSCGQCSEILVSGGDNYLRAGHGTTNGAFQVIPWPGSGTLDVEFDYRGDLIVRILGGHASDTINQYNNVYTLDVIDSEQMADSSSWAAGSLSTNLSGNYDYLVIQVITGDVDNISAIFE